MASHILPLPTGVNDPVPTMPVGSLVQFVDPTTKSVTWYRYVQFKDAVTYVASPKMVLTWADTACTTVTNDRAGGSSIGQIPAGVCINVQTQNYYGFIQVSGVVTVGPTDGSVALGELVVPHATTDGGVDTWSSTLQPFGVALADDVSTTSVIVKLTGLI